MHARNICMLEIHIHDVRNMKSRNFCEICEFRSNSRMFILTKVFQILQNFFIFFLCVFTQRGWEAVVADTICLDLSNLPSVDLFDDMDPML